MFAFLGLVLGPIWSFWAFNCLQVCQDPESFWSTDLILLKPLLSPLEITPHLWNVNSIILNFLMHSLHFFKIFSLLFVFACIKILIVDHFGSPLLFCLLFSDKYNQSVYKHFLDHDKKWQHYCIYTWPACRNLAASGRRLYKTGGQLQALSQIPVWLLWNHQSMAKAVELVDLDLVPPVNTPCFAPC